jgi:hypothetical protein
MTDQDIPVKTSAGTEEVKARSRKLSPRLRTMLIMADGQLNAAQLRQAAATLGAPADCLEMLMQQGLIAPMAGPTPVAAASGAAVAAAEASATPTPMTDGERFRAAQKFMNDNAVDALGIRAFFFTLKLEKCFTAADLLALMPDFSKAIVKGSGEPTAKVLEARARQILGG